MATTNPTRATDRDDRTTRVHHLAAQNLSNRAIARQLGIHHTTVGRILRTTRAPERTTPEQPERTTPAPERTTPPTSNNRPAPRLLLPLDPDLIQDLNVLRDPRTGALPAPLRAMLRTAADARRTTMRATVHRIAAEERTTGRPPSGRAPGRAQVAP